MWDDWWNDEFVRDVVNLLFRVAIFVAVAVIIEWWQMSDHVRLLEVGSYVRAVVRGFFVK
jgi:hypothetical protein